jgi:hypothetical protein
MYEIKKPSIVISLSVNSIFFGGFENVATKKLTVYFKIPIIEKTKIKV